MPEKKIEYCPIINAKNTMMSSAFRKPSKHVYLDHILPGHIMITLPLLLLLRRILHIFGQPSILLFFLFLLSGRQQREGGKAAEPREGAVQTLLRGHTMYI